MDADGGRCGVSEEGLGKLTMCDGTEASAKVVTNEYKGCPPDKTNPVCDATKCPGSDTKCDVTKCKANGTIVTNGAMPSRKHSNPTSPCSTTPGSSKVQGSPALTRATT